jgi:hypothetical protein
MSKNQFSSLSKIKAQTPITSFLITNAYSVVETPVLNDDFKDFGYRKTNHA